MTKNGQVDWEKLKTMVYSTIHMQDNVIDATPYFLPENTKQALGERRIGMGVMGLHDLLIRCGLRYGSTEGNVIINEVFRNMAIWAYEKSIELAKEKGSFPFLEGATNAETKRLREAFVNTGFMKKMPERIRQGVLDYGIRNSHLITVAPTGSTGTMMGVSTGLEPYFGFMYFRSGRLGKNIPVIADIALEWLDKAGYVVTEENVEEMIEKLPKHFVSAMDLSPEEHADVQCIIQNWVDSSISKTVNAPSGYTVEQVASVYERLHRGGAKGGTVYVNGTRDAQVLSLTKEDNDLSKVEIVGAKGLSNEKKETVIGIEIGETCPICQIGEVIDSAGCNTCSNCGSQLKCGL